MCSFLDLVVIARAKHPTPFRTRQLSAVAPMVLRLKTWESRSPPNLVRNTSCISRRCSNKNAALRGGFFVFNSIIYALRDVVCEHGLQSSAFMKALRDFSHPTAAVEQSQGYARPPRILPASVVRLATTQANSLSSKHFRACRVSRCRTVQPGTEDRGPARSTPNKLRRQTTPGYPSQDRPNCRHFRSR